MGQHERDEEGPAPPGAPRAPEGPPSVLQFVTGKTGRETRVTLRQDGADAEEPVIDPRSPARGALPRGRGNYQLLGEIARGGMGVVLKGHDTDLGRDVALKVLHEDLAADPGVLQRFVEEAQIGGQLQHPGIVPVYELGLMADERPFFTMKLVKGKTLAGLLGARTSPRDDRARLLDVFESVCQTMAYAHSRGVIHRDLKPSNVMVGAFGEVQVVDWGLAKVLAHGGAADDERSRREQEQLTVLDTVRSRPRSGSSHSVAGSIMGTPAYMSPEQAVGRVDELDERSDVFSLGAILCEVLTGLPPYPGDFGEAIQRAADADLTDAEARLDACGAAPELVALAKECLRPARLARPRSAEVLALRIREHVESSEERARAAQVDAAVQRRAKWLWSVVVAVVVLSVGGGLAWRARENARELARVFAVEGDVRAARYEAESLVERARSEGDEELWNRALAAARRAQTLVATHGLDRGGELEGFVASVEDGRESFRSQRALDTRRAQFLRVLGRLSGSPMGFMGSDVHNREQSEQYGEAFAALGHDPRRAASAAEAATALLALGGDEAGWGEALGVALDSWSGAAFATPGSANLARELLEVADLVDPDPLRSRLRSLMIDNDREEVERLVTSPAALEASPTSVLMIMALLQRNSVLRGMTEVVAAGRENHPDDLALNMVQGMMPLYNREELWRSLPYFVAAQSVQPEEPAARFFEAGIRAALGEEDLARRALETALELGGADSLWRYATALANGFRISRRLEGLAPVEALLRSRADVPGVRLALAPVLQAGSRHAEAVPLLREAVRGGEATDSGLMLMLATSLMMTGQDGEAIATLREALRTDPDDPALLQALAWEVVTCPDPSLRDAELAVELSERLCGLAPDVPAFAEVLGAALYRAGDLDGALGVLELSTELNAGDELLRANLVRAMVLFDLGEPDEARAVLAGVRRVPPGLSNLTDDWLQVAERLVDEAVARLGE